MRIAVQTPTLNVRFLCDENMKDVVKELRDEWRDFAEGKKYFDEKIRVNSNDQIIILTHKYSTSVSDEIIADQYSVIVESSNGLKTLLLDGRDFMLNDEILDLSIVDPSLFVPRFGVRFEK